MASSFRQSIPNCESILTLCPPDRTNSHSILWYWSGYALPTSNKYSVSIRLIAPHTILTVYLVLACASPAYCQYYQYYLSISLIALFHPFNIGLAIRLSVAYTMLILGICPPHPINSYLILCKGFGWALPVHNQYYLSIRLRALFHPFNIGLPIRLSVAYIIPILRICPPHPINSYSILCKGFGWALPVHNQYYLSISLRALFHQFNIGLPIRLSVAYTMSILGICLPHPINSYLILCNGFGCALPVHNQYYLSIRRIALFLPFNIRLPIRLSVAHILSIFGICPPHPLKYYAKASAEHCQYAINIICPSA